MYDRVEIVEVAPRDGLQNEMAAVSTADKLTLIGRAVDAGVRRMEAASFVHPGRVPQMADAEAVAAGLDRRQGVTYIGLALNTRGAQRALNAGMDELGAVAVASDLFAQRNQGQTSAGSLMVACDIVALARNHGRSAQITIATAFGCPFEGEVPADRVVEMASVAAGSGPREVALADTIGAGSPGQVEALVRAVQTAIAPIPVRVHFHNTRNNGLANVWAAISAGASVVDASIGGIGGCPFAPRATGNVPTEDVAYMLERSGISTSLSLDVLIEAARWLDVVLGRQTPGMLARAGRFPSATSIPEPRAASRWWGQRDRPNLAREGTLAGNPSALSGRSK